jgi:hypothetical protein
LQCAFEDLEKYKYRIIIDEFTFVCDFAMKLFKLNGIEINIEHLHQLQNLCFTLTKQELPININAVETNSYGEVKTVCDKWAKQMIEAPLNVIEKDADIKQCMCCEKKVEYSTGIFTCKDCSI